MSPSASGTGAGADRTLLVRSVAAITAVIALFALRWLFGTDLFVALTVSGITLGAIYALSGLGLVITYRASGVFNFAHGAIAMFVAYVLWQLVRVWGVPVPIAAFLALVIAGPAIGALLSRTVFRPLEERGAGEVASLVATVGIFILLVGLAVAIWGPQTKTDPVALFGTTPLSFFGLFNISLDQLAIVVLTAATAVGIWALFERTGFGLRMRAVVENRDLAELSAVDADRVSMVAWAIGAGLAGLTGVLLAPTTFGLDPFHLTLLVAETFAVAVIARLRSLSLALVGGTMLGLAVSYGTQVDFAAIASFLGAGEALAADAGRLLQPLLASIPVIVLFLALFVHRSFAGLDRRERAPHLTATAVRLSDRQRTIVASVVAGMLLVAPFLLDTGLERRVQDMMGLAIVFLSITVITGIGGHLTLGQAAFAGLGAFLTGRLIAGSFPLLPAFDPILATVVAAAIVVPLGVLVALPALRRRGLVFGLTTFAVGLVLERFVFANYEFTSGPGVLAMRRPRLFGVSLAGDVAFHFYALVWLGLAVAITWSLRRGRLGRALAALRDSPRGASAVGIRGRRYTVLTFVVGSVMAAVGGSLMAQTAGTFASQRFGSFDSLIWFTAVVVAGAHSINGALLAAFALTVLSGFVGDTGVITLLIGIGALLLGRLPGGLVGALARLVGSRKMPARRGPADLAPSPLARRLLARRREGVVS